MPYYEYECEVCGKPLTRYMPRIPDVVPQQVVDICSHGDRVSKPANFKRVMSLPNFHLKGKGWAKDGYVNPLSGVDGLEHVSGERFTEEYRKQINDPEHPLQVGDILKKVGRKDDFKDLDEANAGTVPDPDSTDI